jgi:hypothetical protein
VRWGVEGAHCDGWDLEGFSGGERALDGTRWERAKHPGKDEVGALGYDCVVRLECSGLGGAEPNERSDCFGPRLAHHRCFQEQVLFSFGEGRMRGPRGTCVHVRGEGEDGCG